MVATGKKVTITVNGVRYEAPEGVKILNFCRHEGIEIPTLCHLKDYSDVGSCRMCMVEDDRGKMFASCSEQPRAGMVIHTNTKKLQQYRKLIIELLLSTHCRDCTTCIVFNCTEEPKQ